MSTPDNPGGGGEWRPPDESGGGSTPSGQGWSTGPADSGQGWSTGPADSGQGWGTPPGQQGNYGAPQGGQWQAPPYGQQPIPNYLVWSILTTLFCCLPFGIVSIVYAAQVNGKQAGGDYAGALDASKKAKTWAIAAAASGVVVIVLYILFVVAMGMSGGFGPQPGDF